MFSHSETFSYNQQLNFEVRGKNGLNIFLNSFLFDFSTHDVVFGRRWHG